LSELLQGLENGIDGDGASRIDGFEHGNFEENPFGRGIPQAPFVVGVGEQAAEVFAMAGEFVDQAQAGFHLAGEDGMSQGKDLFLGGQAEHGEDVGSSIWLPQKLIN
jgi:hypothetical protein